METANPMIDSQGLKYAELLAIQLEQLRIWQTHLKPERFVEVSEYVLRHNAPATAEGRHRVYRGQDLMLIIFDWPNLCSVYPPVESADQFI